MTTPAPKVVRESDGSTIYDDGSMDYYFDENVELTTKDKAKIIKHFRPDGSHLWLSPPQKAA